MTRQRVPRDGSGEVIVGEHVFDGTGEFRQLIAKRLHAQSGRTRSIS